MALTSYAQTGEDLQIAYLLGERRNITYIDVGCLWPVEHSNTYFFYERGGHGLCIDPNPTVAAEFRERRPRDVFLTCAISTEPGRAEYFMHENPVFNTLSPQRAEDVRRKAKGRPGRQVVDRIETDVLTLDEAVVAADFETRCPSGLDVLSIDVEGLEKQVVESYSFTPLRPRLVVFEHLRRGRAEPQLDEHPVVRLLRARNYFLAAWTGHDVYMMDVDP